MLLFLCYIAQTCPDTGSQYAHADLQNLHGTKRPLTAVSPEAKSLERRQVCVTRPLNHSQQPPGEREWRHSYNEHNETQVKPFAGQDEDESPPGSG